MTSQVNGNSCDTGAYGNGHVNGTSSQPQRTHPILFTLYKGKKAKQGWRAEFDPPHQALSHFEFDVLVDASGKSSGCLSRSLCPSSCPKNALFFTL